MMDSVGNGNVREVPVMFLACEKGEYLVFGGSLGTDALGYEPKL